MGLRKRIALACGAVGLLVTVCAIVFLTAEYQQFARLKQIEADYFEITLEGEQRFPQFHSMTAHNRYRTFWEFLRAKPVYIDHFGTWRQKVNTRRLVQNIAELPSIKNLDARGFPLTESDFAILADHNGLEEMETCGPMSNKVAASIGRMTKLRMLVLDCELSPQQMQSLMGLQQLETLSLQAGGQFTKGCLQGLSQLPSLREVYLREAKLVDSDLKHLNAIQSLNSLGLRDMAITSLSALKLTTVKRLKWLHCSGTPLTSEGLAILKDAQNLEELCLWDCDVDDRFFSYIAHLPSLKLISISEANYTEDGLKLLSYHPTLEYLYVAPSNVSEPFLASIRATLPNCKNP